MLMLKLQYFGHLMWKADSLEKTLILGKIEGRRRRGWQRWDGWMALPTEWTWVWVSSRSWWWTGRPSVLQSVGSQRVGHDGAIEQNWMETDIEYRFVDTVGEGEVEMNSESSMETHFTICKIDSQWEFAIWCRELNPVFCDNLERWDGRLEGGPRGRRHVYLADSCWCMAEANTIL